MRFHSIAAIVATFSTALITGVFYAWVCTTMWGLDQIRPQAAIEAMNGMNISVQNGLFFPVFFLTPVFLLIAAAANWFASYRSIAFLFLIAACVYLLFTLLPTATVSVPMNRELELIVDPTSIDNAAEVWTTYSSRWQNWNIVRTVGCAISLVIALVALLKIPKASTA